MAQSNVKRIKQTMANCEQGWRRAGHKNALSALRWFLAYDKAIEPREISVKNTAWDLLDGIPAIPSTISGLIRCCEEEAEFWFEDKEGFWNELIYKIVKFYK